VASGSATLRRSQRRLIAALRERHSEIEQAVTDRTLAVSEEGSPQDPAYQEGLRATITAAVEFGLEVIERGEERAPPPPPLLLAQARLAARNGVGLDTVLRRYSAGYALLSDFMAQEAERCGMGPEALRDLLRTQSVLDRLLAAVSEEYAREQSERPTSSEQKRAERIERLLGGEPLDTSGLAYDFEGAHLSLVASGSEALEALRALASQIDANLLCVRRPDGQAWAWLGSRRELDPAEVLSLARSSWPQGAHLALGEPAQGPPGWRFSHRQARAALAVAQRGPQAVVRYAEVALLAAALKDELLATSLRRLYLEPLQGERDGGRVLIETLRAYFEAGRNVSAAAAVLRVSRQAANSRLRAIEERVGRPLSGCAWELETALRLDEIDPTGTRLPA
jgi:CheY-like chemotaxis protein